MNKALDLMEWLSWEFWVQTTQQLVQWGIHAVPKMLLVVALTIVALRLFGLACGQIAKRASAAGAVDGHNALEHDKRVQTLVGILKRVGFVAIWSLAVMLFLVQVGVNVAPMIAGAGVIGLAVGFGAQELVRDVISGFFLLLENHVRKGDVVEINGKGGVVEAIGLRTIALRDLSGVVHIVQNGKVDTLANRTKGWSACVFEIGVAYKEDATQVMEVMKEVAAELTGDEDYGPKILEPFEMFGVESFGDNAVILKARFKTRPIEQWSVAREYRRRLKHVFDAKNIEIPFPHRTLYFGDERSAAPLRRALSPRQSGSPQLRFSDASSASVASSPPAGR